MGNPKAKGPSPRFRLLAAKKDGLFSIIQKLFDLSKDLSDESAVDNFLSRCGSLESTKDSLLSVLDEWMAEGLESDPKFVPNYDILETIEGMCGQIESVRRSVTTEKNDKFLENAKGNSVRPSGGKPRLPKIEVPTFSGDIREWETFFSLFKSLVHENKEIDKADKMYYLVGCLRGTARNICAGIGLTEDNYDSLWDSLVERFQDKRSLANSYLRQILEFKDFKEESEKGLNLFLEKFDAPLRALKNLGLNDLADYIFVFHALSNLNSETANYFELNRNSTGVPTYQEVSDFLKLRLKTLSSRKSQVGKSKDFGISKPKASKSFVVNSSKSDKEKKCSFCKSSEHRNSNCDVFKALSAEKRYSKVKELNLCFKCLSEAHGVRVCPLTSGCSTCGKNHHSLLHDSRNPGSSAVAVSEPVKTLHSSVSVSAEKSCNPTILLGTVAVKVNSPFGDTFGRFLLDNGSQANLVTLRFAKKLGLNITKVPSSVQGLGGVSQAVKGSINFVIRSRCNENASYPIRALVVEKITGQLPQHTVVLENSTWLAKVPLADLKFGVPGIVDGIFGAEIFSSIIRGGRIKHSENGPVALETSLGYVVMGNIPAKEKGSEPLTFFATCHDPSVEELVKKFWELEDIPQIKSVSQEEQNCEELFQKEFLRDETGRFTVALPFFKSADSLGNSREIAKRRFFGLEARLEKNPEVKEAYCKAMKDFVDQGHLYPVNATVNDQPEYFIPHHAVYKPDSVSTPVRIVLDASAATDNGLSLNSILLSGPKLQIDILGLLIKFRLFKIALTSDIRQMYRQINVTEPHRKFQRLYWRWKRSETLKVWELKTLAFGVKSSPFLALRCVKQLLIEDGHIYPETTKLVKDNLYMDDLVVSVPDEETAWNLYRESVELFQRGKFELTKWSSNSADLMMKIPPEKQAKGDKTFKSETKILGLIWSPGEDQLWIKFPSLSTECTKRSILSSVARCYDPIGLSAPLTLCLKLLIKELWNLNLGWDEPAPDSIRRRWKQIISEWSLLETLRVARSFEIDPTAQISLVGFADASQVGYGAVVYIRTERLDGNFDMQLICAKSRVSPLKTVSIPRLELCAAVLLSDLLNYLIETLKPKIKISKIWAFSDSTTVLQWLGAEKIADVFVNNRISKIKDCKFEVTWCHISGKDNPADGLSRGLTPAQLIENTLWLNGPDWSSLSESEWPCRQGQMESSQVFLAATTDNTDAAGNSEPHPLLKLIEEKSSWTMILRITVWVLRALKKISKGKDISVQDLQSAKMYLVTTVQRAHFADEFRRLKEGKEPSKGLRHLRPFLHQGVLRVGGRLSQAKIPFEQQHQMILPKKSLLSLRLIDYYHLKYFHAGAYLVETLLRQKFWIVGGTSKIKNQIRKCNRCFRLNPTAPEPLMGNLPECRVTQAKPFFHTGVDYFGPVKITLGRKRGAAVHKAYVALFICMSVKAIHLELVSSLSTEHFLQAFKRFLARRGPCKRLFSDRGTNFVGARRALSGLDTWKNSAEVNEEIKKELAEQSVEWKFNPAAAPHMGGLWESNVKVVKRHLLRVIGDQLLTYEEFNTLLVEIEGLLNSRPLCALSSDPMAPAALTPAHFLTLTPLKCLPAEDLTESNLGRLDRFQLIDKMIQGFWKRWHLEYLTSLQHRQKWTAESPNVKAGTIVLLKMDNSPPLRWPLGVIVSLYPGKDGIVRSVKVKTSAAEYVRPVVKVCPLPTQ